MTAETDLSYTFFSVASIGNSVQKEIEISQNHMQLHLNP